MPFRPTPPRRPPPAPEPRYVVRQVHVCECGSSCDDTHGRMPEMWADFLAKHQPHGFHVREK